MTAGAVAQMLFVAELAEILMSFISRLFSGWNRGNSMGEGLSHVAVAELHPDGYYAANYGPQVNGWLNANPRPDWVTSIESTDKDSISSGCASVFLYYLRYQLGFSYAQIVEAGQGNKLPPFGAEMGITYIVNSVSPTKSQLLLRNTSSPGNGSLTITVTVRESLGRSSPGTHGHSRTVLHVGPPAGGHADPLHPGENAFYVTLQSTDADEIKPLWDALSDGATAILIPLAPAAFAPLYGMLTDRFDVTWIVGVDPGRS